VLVLTQLGNHLIDAILKHIARPWLGVRFDETYLPGEQLKISAVSTITIQCGVHQLVTEHTDNQLCADHKRINKDVVAVVC
jgi:hypothetical protein